MISKVNEKWIAETNFPDCGAKFIAESKEELAELVYKDMEAHRKVYESHKSGIMKGYCIKCLVKLIKLAEEIENSPIE